MNRKRLTRWLYPTLGFFFLVFSFCILNREIGKYNLNDIVHSLTIISDRQLVSALGFTILGYLAISSYDLVAFFQLNYYLNIRRILLTTFITYAVSNTTGFNLLIGGGIRYRFYSTWKVPTKSIAKIIALGNLTFWLGLLTLSGFTFITNPLNLPSSLRINILFIRCLGIVALTLVGIYLFWCKRRKRWKIGKKIVFFPKLTTSIFQIVLFSLDWAFAAAVLYCLIPNYLNKTYLDFFNTYLLAMTASILSNIPGGIGIFETVIIFLLPKTIATPDILGSLLAYRAIRFLIPLGTALLVLCGFEIQQRLKPVKK